MINNKIVCRALGSLLYIETLLLGISMAVGIYFGERDYLTFGVPVAVSFLLASWLHFKGRRAQNRLGRRDGFLIVSLTWIVFSAVGMLPFLVGGYTGRVAVAFFETMSGFSTTGATAFADLEVLPESILFWRALTHWMGGMGIVFFTLAVLPSMGADDQKLFSAETTGLKLGKLHPRISTTARWLWSLYLLLTIACCVCYYVAGMTGFDAICHAFSTIATGGFSTHTQSLAFFHSKTISYVAIVFMALAGINFSLLYLLLVKRRFRQVFRDPELRLYLTLIVTATVFIGGCLWLYQGEDVAEAGRRALFNVVSVMTTSGFTEEDFMLWPPLTWLALFALTLSGACAGSTSGGIKIVRLLTSYKLIKLEVLHMLHPHAVFPLRLGETNISRDVARTIFAFLTTYSLLAAAGTLLLAGMGLPLTESIGLCVTSLSNVGPCLGQMIGPTGSWDVLPDPALWLLSFLMLAGRLEIFSLLLPFLPAFWRDN